MQKLNSLIHLHTITCKIYIFYFNTYCHCKIVIVAFFNSFYLWSHVENKYFSNFISY